MLIGINEAARLTGKSKSVIWNKTKAGTLSSVSDGDGKKKYQVSELERVFGTLSTPEPRTERTGGVSNQTEPTERTEELRLKLAEAQKEVEFLRERVKDKDERIEELRQDRDRWHSEFQSMKALPAPAASSPPAKPGFWARLTGRTA
jgi:hypothetical protein